MPSLTLETGTDSPAYIFKMPTLSYKLAMEKELLNPQEIGRLACAMLSMIEEPEVKSRVSWTLTSSELFKFDLFLDRLQRDGV